MDVKSKKSAQGIQLSLQSDLPTVCDRQSENQRQQATGFEVIEYRRLSSANRASVFLTTVTMSIPNAALEKVPLPFPA